MPSDRQTGSFTHTPRIPELYVRTPSGELRFTAPFDIGRDDECAVRVDDVSVSRRHVSVSFGNGHWWLRDGGSRNGTYVDGERVETAAIDDVLTIRLGAEGPFVEFAVGAAPAVRRRLPEPDPQRPDGEIRPPAGNPPPAGNADRYFDLTSEEPAGEHTLMIRQAFRQVQRKQQGRYVAIIAAVALIALVAAAYAVYTQHQINAQRDVAENLFYSIKALDVDIAGVEQIVAASGTAGIQEQVRRYRDRRRQLQTDYDTFVSQARLYDRKLTDEQRLILRVTRIFGECDVAAPPRYLEEVANYIRKWQSTGRYTEAVRVAQQHGYVARIARELLAQNVAPQFFYLALQESDFDPYTSGPPTYKGIAKGMWQFIPETGEKYGLRTGPLASFRRPDPADDRHNWEKATAAAARYIKDIYATDAQASGLLVVASYNWGEDRVVNLLRQMPANPRERNFWKLLQQHRDDLPKETYDYVFYVVSAAVIGENPRLFGFAFDNPLQFLEKP